jgi:hypothetical protein
MRIIKTNVKEMILFQHYLTYFKLTDINLTILNVTEWLNYICWKKIDKSYLNGPDFSS